ncbi:MAG TPA: methyltransferase domain-containing protein [Polyangiaceae bacterium]
MSEPPAPKDRELAGEGEVIPLDVDLDDEPGLVVPPPPRPPATRSRPPWTAAGSSPPLATPRPEAAPQSPIAAMPIITLGVGSRDGDSVEVVSTGVRRSSIPPPLSRPPPRRTSSAPPARSPSVPDSSEEITPPRLRPPADSLIQAIPSPRPPLESDPNVKRPSYEQLDEVRDRPPTQANGESALGALGEEGVEELDIEDAIESELTSEPETDRRAEGAAEPAPEPAVERPHSEPAPDSDEDLLPDDVVDSIPEGDSDHPAAEQPEEEIEPEPDSEPSQREAATDERAIAESAAEPLDERVTRATDPPPAEPLTPSDRTSDIPPEVDPEDMEIHEAPPPSSAASSSRPAIPASLQPTRPAKQSATGRVPPLPLPLPLYARADTAQGAQSEAPTFKRARHWWDELFGDDFLRTMDRLTDAQIRNEVAFIEESLGVEKGGIVLDLACGAGRHAVEMAVRGYNVVGYDLSLAMLARAADEAQARNQKLNFLHGDMRDMGFEEMFDGVYCWSTSFGFFDDEKNQLVAQRVHRALRKGGMLLLDVANRDFVAQRQPSLVWFEGDGCVVMDDMRVDFITSRLRVKRMVMLDDGRTRELDYSIRLYTLHELGRMLHDVGFKVTDVSGHPATPGVFMGADSPRLIVLAEKG